MKSYFAKANIGIFGQGLVTPGEILNEKQLAAIGSERVEEMVREGAMGFQEEAPPSSPVKEKQPEEAQEAAHETDETENPEESEEPDLNLSPDEVVVEEAAPKADKPEKGGKGKNKP